MCANNDDLYRQIVYTKNVYVKYCWVTESWYIIHHLTKSYDIVLRYSLFGLY